MHRAGRNPIRRNRKIGATQGGRVQDGRSMEKWSRVFPPNVWKTISDTPRGVYRIVRENPSNGFFHPCDGAEYLDVLARLPKRLKRDLGAIVLRRTPKRDQWMCVEARRRYGCIIMNAFPADREMVWYRPATAAERRHYGRWCDRWSTRGRHTVLTWTDEELRAYYRYHLFLHELGHINDHRHRPRDRREAFAEDFALRWAKRLKQLPPPVRPASDADRIIT